jgi:hypothetical protein
VTVTVNYFLKNYKNNLIALFLCNKKLLTFLDFQHLTGQTRFGYYLGGPVRVEKGAKLPNLSHPSRWLFSFSENPNMAKTITITMEDDGTITVASDEMQEPYKCNSIDECKQFVDKMLTEEGGESPQEQATEGPEDYSKMWNQEAQARKPQPGLMA